MAAVLALAGPGVAWGQTWPDGRPIVAGGVFVPPGLAGACLSVSPNGQDMTWAPCGPTGLDRAEAICDAHKVRDSALSPSSAWHFAPEVAQSCAVVDAKWRASDAGRKQREAEAKEAADVAFVNDMAAKLREGK